MAYESRLHVGDEGFSEAYRVKAIQEMHEENRQHDAERESIMDAVNVLAEKALDINQTGSNKVSSLNVRMHANGAVSISANVKVSRYLGVPK